MRPIEDLINFSVINVNKPSGILSLEVDKKIRKIFHVKKVGHAGTLDPKASGVLVVAMGEATKILGILMNSDKEYEGVIHLHKDVERDKIEKVVKEKFIGEIIQTPPLRSRVSRKPRKRVVYSFNILEKNGKEVKFKCQVEAGTYIRKLVHDIGLELGVGAHLKYLKRIRSGKFSIENSYTIQEIERAFSKWEKGNESELSKILIPIEEALDIKKVKIKEKSIPRMMSGKNIRLKDLLEKVKIKPGERVGILSPSGYMIGLGLVKSWNKIKTDRVFNY